MSFKIQINVKNIRDKIDRFSLPKAQNIGSEKARKIITKKRDKFIKDFKNHPITREILSGPSGGGSAVGYGNLASFLGFDDGAELEAIDDLLYYFQEQTMKLVNSRGSYNKGDKTITYKMSLPRIETIKNITELSKYATEFNDSGWGEGRSWAISIERGIPGLNRYKFSTDPKILGGDSRSGTGLQRKNVIRPGAVYKPRPYILALLKELINE